MKNYTDNLCFWKLSDCKRAGHTHALVSVRARMTCVKNYVEQIYAIEKKIQEVAGYDPEKR